MVVDVLRAGITAHPHFCPHASTAPKAALCLLDACPPLRLTAGVAAVGASPCDRFQAAESRARGSRALDVSRDGNHAAPPVDVAWASPGGLLSTVPEAQ